MGYPVCSLFPGVVVAAGAVGSWGGIVVVRADDWVRDYVYEALGLPPSPVLEVQAAHLGHVSALAGQVVNAGDVLGSVGKGTYAQYVAHLHLEVRRTSFDLGLPQGGDELARQFALANCLDPLRVLSLASDHPNTLAQRAYYAPTRILGLEHAGESAALVHPVGDKLYLEGFHG